MQDTRQPGTAATVGDGRRTIGIVLCDDMPDLRELTRYGLEQDLRLRVVGEAGSAEQCFEVVRELVPDVLLLDVTLPDMDGLDAIPRLRELVPRLAIVVFSGMDAARMEGRALARGADAYVEKGTSLAEIRKVVLDAARGRGLEIGPSIPLELRADGGRAAARAPGAVPGDVAETLHALEDLAERLERLCGELLDERDRDSLTGLRDALASLRARLAD